MIKAVRPGRIKSLKNKYLPLVLIALASFLGVDCTAQTGFPTRDSLHRYNNRYIKNTPVEAFSNLRLNTLLHGIIAHIDSVAVGGGGGGTGLDSIVVLNDSTIRYRKNGVFYTMALPGLYASQNGITSYGGVIGFGGTLIQNTDLDQNDLTLQFQSGIWKHVTGDYTDFIGAYSVFQSGNVYFFSDLSDGAGTTSSILNTLASGGQVKLQSANPTGSGEIIASGDGNYINHSDGKTFIPNLIDSVQAKAVYINPATGRLTAGDAGGGGSGGISTIVTDVSLIWDAGTTTLKVDSAQHPTMWKLYDVIDSLAAGVSGGLSVVTHDITLLDDGTPGDPLKVDTTVISTLSKLYEIADSLGVVIDTSDFPGIFAGAGISITGSYATGFTVNNTGAPGTNPHNALDIRNYGGVANAVVPATGLNATGTNNTPALNAMLAAAADGQLCIVPSGNWLFSTAPDSIYLKRLNLLILGNTYHNQQNFIVIKNNTGAFKQHRFVHAGIMSGMANLPQHRKTPSRISPNWASYTGTAITVLNTDQVKVWFNKIQGFKNGLEVKGSLCNGSQENEFYGGWLSGNANDIALTSVDGCSFVDKNKFFVARLGGGLGIDIDGFSGLYPLVTGEQYNGAFRSNEFHCLFEFIDSAIVANGDITEPLFNLTVEGGVNTGILGTQNFQCRSVSPNYVRNPKWTGQGYYDASRLGSGSSGTMGINGVIETPIWSAGSTVYYGRRADIMGDGSILIECPSGTSASTRNAAPAYLKFLNQREPEKEYTHSSAGSYTPVVFDRYVTVTNAAGSITLPTASAWPQRKITIINDAGSTISVLNVASGYSATVATKTSKTYRDNGSSWLPIDN